MADPIRVYEDSSNTDHSDTESHADQIDLKTVPVPGSAKSARELVRSQENLVGMLQDLSYELSKMDREASKIREDIIRSKQAVNMVIDFRHTYAFPAPFKIDRISRLASPMTYTPRDPGLTLRNLTRIATTVTPSMESRYVYRTIPRYTDKQQQRLREHAEICSRSSSRSSRLYRSFNPDAHLSATESEAEDSRYWSRVSTGSTHTPSMGSLESIYEALGSSTESLDMLGHAEAMIKRRSSYFYIQRTTNQQPSDIVDV